MEASGKPLIVQSDATILLDVHSEGFVEARDRLMRFAELVKSPEHIHIYRVTPISLWNAAAAGISADNVLSSLNDLSRYPVPANLKSEIRDEMARFGLLKLTKSGGELLLAAKDRETLERVLSMKTIRAVVVARKNGTVCSVDPCRRGCLKLKLVKAGYPVEDLAGYKDGTPFPLNLSETLWDGKPFLLRSYQKEALEAFYAGGSVHGGSGVIVLPCGAGKTVVGMAVMAQLGMWSLVLCTSITALRQWKRELLEKTSVGEQQVGEYSGEKKELKPITLSTYQIMAYRSRKAGSYPHLKLFSGADWGLVVYDEVHLLPAPVFSITAEIQATRRLGLTATLIREDGREDEVFSLIGPKKYDIPWRELENSGWIANGRCVEIRCSLDREVRFKYISASRRKQFRLASENPQKHQVVRKLISRHKEDFVLILGQYVAQLNKLRSELGCPIITGKTPSEERERLYAQFREGKLRTLLVSKVGNFAVDLPDANVAIQVSGTFGSRQEEAQRLGRVLRPKKNGAASVFYSIVTRRSRDQEFAEKRQRFLAEQGYEYSICDADNLSG